MRDGQVAHVSTRSLPSLFVQQVDECLCEVANGNREKKSKSDAACGSLCVCVYVCVCLAPFYARM